MAVLAAAGIAAAGSVIAGGIGAGASKSAASKQADANTHAADLVFQMYQQTAARLKPFVDTGVSANTQLGSFLGLPGSPVAATGGFAPGAGVQPFQPTMAQLEQTPGYQFTKAQGLQATTNAATAMGLGKSGSLLKGIDSFTTGLASTTYQQQFNNYWSQLGNVFNMLQGVSTSGANAAAQTGQAGTTAAAQQGNFTAAAGQNQAAGTLNAANALTGSIGSVSSLPLQLALFNQAQGAAGGGGTTLAGTVASPNQLNVSPSQLPQGPFGATG
jgi:hypothetical protein